MKNAKILIISFLVFSVNSCGSIQKSHRIQTFDQLREVVDSGDFIIENDWLQPLGSSMINLLDNPNYIRFIGDSVNVFLPYFGVRQSGGGYASGGEGIHFSGPAQKLRIKENYEDGKIVLRFEGNQGSENLRFIITLFSNGTSSTAVNTTQRNSVSYRGHIKPYPDSARSGEIKKLFH